MEETENLTEQYLVTQNHIVFTPDLPFAILCIVHFVPVRIQKGAIIRNNFAWVTSADTKLHEYLIASPAEGLLNSILSYVLVLNAKTLFKTNVLQGIFIMPSSHKYLSAGQIGEIIACLSFSTLYRIWYS